MSAPVVNPKTLRAGDRVINGSLKGAVMAIGPSTVVLVWDGSPAVDMISVVSPLWLFLRTERGQ